MGCPRRSPCSQDGGDIHRFCGRPGNQSGKAPACKARGGQCLQRFSLLHRFPQCLVVCLSAFSRPARTDGSTSCPFDGAPMHAHRELLFDLFGEMRTGDFRASAGNELDDLRSELERAAAPSARTSGNRGCLARAFASIAWDRSTPIISTPRSTRTNVQLPVPQAARAERRAGCVRRRVPRPRPRSASCRQTCPGARASPPAADVKPPDRASSRQTRRGEEAARASAGAVASGLDPAPSPAL